ncbi:HAD family hydrolase [Desulfogranum japonicum]|uniref:HAD family hydrolase n=1 Tax=Desulfogranum japonicum TaxID=231447 RepID=UPI00042669D1|nr:HAD family hydrolase [Desulfogranum japonicum]
MKLLLFDLDNTLIDRNHAFLCRLRQWVLNHAGELDDYEQTRLIQQLVELDDRGQTERRVFYRKAAANIPLDRAKISTLNKEIGCLAENIQPDREIHAMLKRLSGHFKLGIISNGPGKVQRKKIDQAQLWAYFTHCFISGDLGYGKPSPRIFRTALKAFSCSPDQAMMIGDDPIKDIDPAHLLGMKTALVSPLSETHCNADICLRCITDIEKNVL